MKSSTLDRDVGVGAVRTTDDIRLAAGERSRELFIS